MKTLEEHKFEQVLEVYMGTVEVNNVKVVYESVKVDRYNSQTIAELESLGFSDAVISGDKVSMIKIRKFLR